MRSILIGMTLAMTTLFATTTFAEETIVRERTESRPGISVGVPGVNVGIGTQERSTVTTETRRPADCSSKTVRKEDAEGSTTIHKETCD